MLGLREKPLDHPLAAAFAGPFDGERMDVLPVAAGGVPGVFAGVACLGRDAAQPRSASRVRSSPRRAAASPCLRCGLTSLVRYFATACAIASSARLFMPRMPRCGIARSTMKSMLPIRSRSPGYRFASASRTPFR